MRVVLDSAWDWLPRVKGGDATAVLPLVHDLAIYLDLVERHIAAEEEAIFPIAQELLSARDMEELDVAFAAIACEELEEGVHGFYADFARELAGATSTA